MSTTHFHREYDRLRTLLGGQERFPFVLVSWPAGIGKRALVQQVIQDTLGQHHHTDLLHIRDLSEQLGKRHTLTVKQPTTDTNASYKLDDGSIYQNIGAREIRDRLVRSSHSGTKIVYIEHIERANIAAANALLKHLEEPLPGRYIIATTSSLDDVLMTLRSRALTIHLQSTPSHELLDDLIQQYDISPSQAQQIIALSAAKSGPAHALATDDDLPQLLEDREMLLSHIHWGQMIPLLQALRAIDDSRWPLYRDALMRQSVDEGQYHIADALILHRRHRAAHVQADNALVQLAMDITHQDPVY